MRDLTMTAKQGVFKFQNATAECFIPEGRVDSDSCIAAALSTTRCYVDARSYTAANRSAYVSF